MYTLLMRKCILIHEISQFQREAEEDATLVVSTGLTERCGQT
jgi:hypothetical protein